MPTTVEIDTPRRGRKTVRADCRAIIYDALIESERAISLMPEPVLAREDFFTSDFMQLTGEEQAVALSESCRRLERHNEKLKGSLVFATMWAVAVTIGFVAVCLK
ncbi:hypothetical protein [Taklimakanibacter lacteus]|uniref:hypothetical protein n=1 Tax=Taklimakanibacter lacteus TaxID=2268456 RepID=UPI0013C4E6A3